MKKIYRIFFVVIFVLCLGVSHLPLAFAQGADVEPNNICANAQNVGPVSLPFTLKGSLDTPPDTPDVDFYRLTAPPNTVIRINHEGEDSGVGTLGDPYLGVFSANCTLLAFNDDADTTDSQLQIRVPADGIVIVAATGCCDEGFTGQGDESGTYQITLSAPPPAIGFISGRVIDAVTSAPLSGDESPFASAQLLRCSEGECFESTAFQSLTSDGLFRFEQDSDGLPLPAGTYQIEVSAEQYEQLQIGPFPVAANQNLDTADNAIAPLPVQISAITPCNPIPPEGGVCPYSVTLTNTTTAPFVGTVWSLVESSELGSKADATEFSTNQQPLNLPPAAAQAFNFQFAVPAFVQEGASICADVYVGQNPAPLFNTTAQLELFCIEKGVLEEDFAVKRTDSKQQLDKKQRRQ